MRKHGGTPSRRDKHVTLAAISPPCVARGRFVGGQQSGLAGSKPPPLFTRGASSCSSQGQREGEPRGASPRLIAPTYLPRTIFGIGVGRGVGTRWLYVQGKCTCVEELTFSIFVLYHAFQHLPSTWVKFTKTGSPVRLARTPDEVLSCLVHYLGSQHSQDSHLHLTTMFGNPVYLSWWAATSTLIPGSWQIEKAEGNQLILTGDL